MKQKVHPYRGAKITVYYDAARCIHAAECVAGLPAVFKPNARPWISPDAARPDELARVIERCPTGALGFKRTDHGPHESIPESIHAWIEADGPLYLKGNLELFTMHGQLIAKETRMAVCRCGLSKNKPYCDGSHKEAHFTDAGKVTVVSHAEEHSASRAKLELTCRDDGPVKFSGPLTLHSADGATTVHLREGALCRCGTSGNKPFCDGAHKKIGFTTV
jgi:CDGSH-type Zn-finger protein/uncharacterized Fe-S cluster protein YjdI